MDTALSGMRVLELADETGEYAGKLLADLGAEVIKIEPPGGEASRSMPPFREHGSQDSYWFLYANTSKESREVDLATDEGRATVLRLVDTADVVVTSYRPGKLDRLGLGWDTLHRRNAALVLAEISGFGMDGPRRNWLSSDLVATALAGAAFTTGWPDQPPVALAGYQACMMAGVSAAGGALIALHHAVATGDGQRIDISLQEAMASVSHISGVGKFLDDGLISCRAGASLTASVPSGFWEASDGRIYLAVNRPAHWKALAAWAADVTGNDAILSPTFEGPSSNRQEFREVIDSWLADLFSRHSVGELYAEAQKRHIAITPLNDAAAVIADPHLASRSFFHAPPNDDLLYPGSPYRYSRTPWRIAHRAPRVGESSPLSMLAEASPATKSRPDRVQLPKSTWSRSVERQGEPLSGLRVLELTAGMAGPWVGRMMAYHGADVVKIESRLAADVTRLYVSPSAPEDGISEVLSPWFTDWNAGKRFVGLNLKNREGVAIAKRLALEADVVIENFVPGAIDRLGLGYEVLAASKPDLIYLTTSGFGGEGLSSGFVTWGPNVEAVSGLAALSGFPGCKGAITQYAYSDPVGALHGLVAVMAALAYRERTGQGQHIDIAQMETCVAVIGDVMLQALDGRQPGATGNWRDLPLPGRGSLVCDHGSR